MPPSLSFFSQFSDAQTLPFTVTRLSRLMADESTTRKQFDEVITMNPVLMVRLLKLVNSPYCGLLYKVDSVSRAITLLGKKNLHNIALTEALKMFFIDLTNTSVLTGKGTAFNFTTRVAKSGKVPRRPAPSADLRGNSGGRRQWCQ
ncbi:HDOD domain-containing protein [Desulfosediminicola sp.]|uniref:HDOD domain-containing protein n=1 Tax=Desulfosediminicola sp. TaxID=2886825 RepID=UPI003AF21668